MTATPDPQTVREIAWTPQQVLALPMQQPNDAGAATIRDYLIKLVGRLWEEGECFSGKRPLGNSSWEWDLFIPLVRAGFIAGKFETYEGKETGGLDECDDAAGTGLIAAAIQALGQPDEKPQDERKVRERIAAELDGIAALLEQQAEKVGGNDRTHQTILRLRADTYTNISASIRHGRTGATQAKQPQDERDVRIAQLERELRELRGTELNPSPMVLDAQAYGELRDEIAATMTDGWDLDEAEISVLIKYVRWLAAGQPRDEDGYPIRREGYPQADAKAEQDGRDGDVRAAARVVWMYGTDEHSSEHAYTTIEDAQTEAIWEHDATLAEYPEYWSWESCPPQDGRLAMLCGDDRTGYTVFPVTVVDQRDAALDARDAKAGEGQ